MRRGHVLAAVAALVLVLTAGAAVAAAGPSAPLATSNGGTVTCPGFGQAPITDDDGTVCSHDVSVPGVYYVAHGVTSPKTASVTLEAPYRGFVAVRLRATQMAVSVGYPTDSRRLYSGPVTFLWSVSG
jgi:hypothetical protein